MKLKNFICDMKAQGFTDEEIRYFLEDGEALKNEGFTDQDQDEIDHEHEKIALKELVNCKSEDDLLLSWEARNEPSVFPENQLLRHYMSMIEDSRELQGDQTSRGLYQNVGFSRFDWWVFLHDDWHGFQELREALEFIIDFKDYNLEERI